MTDELDDIIRESKEASEGYRRLMIVSELLQYAAHSLKLHEVTIKKARVIGWPEDTVNGMQNMMSKEDVKLIAQNLQMQLAEYRKKSPAYYVEMYADGLNFLEQLCKKYL